MCKKDDNKAIVCGWFKIFWSSPSDLVDVDELVAPDVLLQYSPNTPRCDRYTVRAFRASLCDAFPDLAIAGASPIADRDREVVCWSGIGTRTGRGSKTTAFRIENGRIAEEAMWVAA